MTGPSARSSPAAIWSDAAATHTFMKGRVALHALLRAAGIGPGDEVLVPGFTCVVVPAAILYTGARPVFFDVDPRSMNGDLFDAERRRTPHTRAVIVQHSFGAMSDPEPWQDFAQRHGLILLEDAAHAMGARYGRYEAGCLGDGAFTSLQWSKVLSCGLGGIARFNAEELRSRFLELAEDYREPSLRRQWTIELLQVAHRTLYRPALAHAVQSVYRRLSAVGLLPGSSSGQELRTADEPPDYRTRFGRSRTRSLRRTLDGLDSVLEYRRRIGGLTHAALEKAGFRTQDIDPAAASTHLRVPVLVENRDEVLARARAERIELGDWFNAPLHPSSAPGRVFGYEPGTCPHAEYLASRLVNLPTHPRVEEADVDRGVAFLRRFAIPTPSGP